MGDYPPVLSAHPAFNLDFNPFEPRVQVDGTRFRYSGSGPLMPQECAQHLPLYFNVYEWKDPTKVNGLAPRGGLTVLLEPRDDRAMVILISGFRGSGRTSALNLLKYEITQRAVQPPVIVEYKTAQITTNLNQHAKEIAYVTQRAVRRLGHVALAGQLSTAQTEWAAAVGETSSNPDMLFSIFADEIRDHVPGLPIVVALDAQDHKVTSDVWRPICRMLGQVARYIIVSLSDRDQAQHFRANLERGEFQVAWIDAPKVSEPRIRQFLSDRLSGARVGPVGPAAALTPFTPEAVQALFRATGENADTIAVPIAVAMSRLADVFQKKAMALSEEVNAGATLVSASVLITGADMERYLGQL
jgi:hypothetical protein